MSFKVDYESYYDSDNNLISKDVIKTMYLTDAGVGELSHNYTSYAISGVVGPSGGGIELSEFTIKSVTGTIKIPKTNINPHNKTALSDGFLFWLCFGFVLILV